MKSTIRALRRQELAKEIAEYARENSGTSADLDDELEAAGIESLRPANEGNLFDADAGPG
jgi:chorismate mutase